MIPYEKALLGACLIDALIFPKITEVLRADHFTPEARVVFVSMRELFERGQSIDPASVSSKAGESAEVGSLSENVPFPTESALETWVDGIKEAGRRRRLAQDIAKLADLALDPALDTRGLLEAIQAVSLGFDFASQDGMSFDPMKLSRAGRDFADELASSGGQPIGVPSGIRKIDECVGGFRPGNIITIGARPSVGKSSLALQIADRAAKHGTPVVFFSLEMEAADLALVRACSEAKVSKWELQKFGDSEDLKRISAAFVHQSQTPLFVEKLYSPTLGAIRASASRLKAQHDLGLIVVDYVQLMQGDNAGRENRNEEITGIMKGLKQMASQLHCPVIVCAQLNRQAAGKDNEPPRLSHFRDSGAIEAETDVALLLHRVNPLADRQLPVEVDVLIEKNRTGVCGSVPLMFIGKHQTFVDREQEL